MALSGCKPKLFCNTARIASALCSVKSTKYIRSNAASLNAADKKRRKCTLIPEDGVGPELVHSVLEVYKGVIDSFETVTAKKSFAFDYAIKNNRKKVTAVHKAFIMSHRFYSNSANEPDESSEPKIQVDGVVKEKLESARKLYVNDMSYQAGFAQAEAVLLPELEARDEKLNQLRGIVGAVTGRSLIDKIFLEKVKPFMQEKTPGTQYTGAEIQAGYIAFLRTNDPFAIQLRKAFPGMKRKKLARKIRNLYGRLSRLDHTLFEIIRSSYPIERVLDFICKIPAVLSPDELETIQSIATAYVAVESDEDTSSDEDDIESDVGEDTKSQKMN